MQIARMLNQNLMAKRNDNFYVTFTGLPDNKSNFLGRQVKELDFPIINFSPIELRHKKNIQKFSTKATMDEISVQFDDDIGGITIRGLYDILYAQADDTQDTFNMQIHLQDYNGDNVNTVTISEMFIQSIAQSQLSYQTGTNSIITVTFAYYNIDFGEPDCNIGDKITQFDAVRDQITNPPAITGGYVETPDVSNA